MLGSTLGPPVDANSMREAGRCGGGGGGEKEEERRRREGGPQEQQLDGEPPQTLNYVALRTPTKG